MFAAYIVLFHVIMWKFPPQTRINLLNFAVRLRERHRSPERAFLFRVCSASLNGTNDHTDLAIERTLGSLSCGATELSLQLAKDHDLLRGSVLHHDTGHLVLLPSVTVLRLCIIGASSHCPLEPSF